MAYLAQPLKLHLRPACGPAEYLRWLSPLGTWEGWAFAGDADTKTDVAESSESATPDQRATVAVRRAALDTLTVRAGDLSQAQHEALSTLLDSPQVFRQLPDGRRQPVLVLPASSITRTSADNRYELELSLKLPARNALTH